MKGLSIVIYEWKHFVRSPFKVGALLLFVLACGYGLHNGAALYQEQMSEIEKIKEKSEEKWQKYIGYLEEGKKGPEDRPWVDLTNPWWAMYYSSDYDFKIPSPAMVYSMGQAEQYGFYKDVDFMASPYDADMTREIANPERLQIGSLDFSFSLLFLLPLLLLILLYNLKSSEAEQGLLPLIEVQTASQNTWLLARVAFYFGMLCLVLTGLLVYGALLTGVFSSSKAAFGQVLLYSLLYLVLWTVMDYFIVRRGRTILGNALTMIGIWLVFAFIIPAGVQQWISIEKPANLMTDYIDASRDQAREIYEWPDSLFQAKLMALYPELSESTAAQDSAKRVLASGDSDSALANEIKKKSARKIQEDSEAKNRMVRQSFFFNPVAFFQNQLNSISETHFDDYQAYREQIQGKVDAQNRVLVLDTWNEVVVDKEIFTAYHEFLSNDE